MSVHEHKPSTSEGHLVTLATPFALPGVWERTIERLRCEHDDAAASSGTTRLGRAFGWVVLSLLVLGWSERDQDFFTPQEGVGYWFGIVGGSLMLLLLLYPLRKRLRLLRDWGNVRIWFQTHMVLGIVGPLFICFHANFHLGALNSNVAFVCMLLVAFSGIVGRYLYVRVCHSAARELTILWEIQSSLGLSRSELMDTVYIPEAVKVYLQNFERSELAVTPNRLKKCLQFMTLGARIRWIKLRSMQILRASLRKQAIEEGWPPHLLHTRINDDRKLVTSYVTAIQGATEYCGYRSLFSLWSLLHIPLFSMLLVTGIGHVIAAHLF